MGIHLRPGHKVESGKKGFFDSGYDDFLKDIKIGNLDLGYWGKKVDKRMDAADAHSPIYSIPNPWASAYLFNYVLSDNSHPLANNLIIQILNIISDFAIHDNLELIEFTKPNEDSPVYKIWTMIPSFIRYNESIWMFKNKNTDELVGGLSKSSLVWASQQYEGDRGIEELKSNLSLKMYLKNIKQQKSPSENFDTFWQHEFIDEMTKAVTVSADFSYQMIDNSPEAWLHKMPPSRLASDFLDVESGCLVFNKEILDKNRPIFKDEINPSGFIKEIIKLKSGDRLPMNFGEIKWVVIDSLLEPYWINNNKIESSDTDTNLVKGLEKGFFYPVKPEFITRYKLKLKDLKIVDTINKGSSNAKAIINWKNKLKVELNTNFYSDTRGIGIWPPFESKYFPNYIIEYNALIDNIQELEKLQFYDKEGEKIEIEGDVISHEGQNFRIYKLSEKRFPRYIRIQEKLKDDTFGGFIEIREKNKGAVQGKIFIGIDFGTSHTSIFYRKDNKIEQILFENSFPILIADPSIKESLIYNFLPTGFARNKPDSEKEWKNKIPWQPFQTQWMEFSKKTDLKSEYIEGGIIPFLHYSADTTQNPIYNNLKWGAPSNISTYRKLFLKQLLIMTIVEAETIGFEDLEIAWSYPKAFSEGQFSNIKSDWSKFLAELNIATQT